MSTFNESGGVMLTRSEFEQWANQIGVKDRQTLDDLYPLVSNLWVLARKLEQLEPGFNQESRPADFSTSATGE